MRQYDFIRDRDASGDDAIIISNRPKKKLDLWPRIICLLLAIIFWLYVVNINDTDVSATIKVKLGITGTDELMESKGLMVYGLQTQEITITVKGSNRDIKKYSTDDYGAVIDVSAIEEAGKHTVEVKPSMPAGSSVSVVSVEPQNVTIYADTVITKTIPFNVVTGAIATVSEYEWAIEQSSDSLEISGPKAIVESIASAKYTVEGEFYSSKSFSGFAVDFCDANGAYLLYDNNIVTYSTSDITVKMNVMARKNIPIVVEVTGDGKDLQYTLSQSYVSIVGDPNALSQVSEYVISLTEAVEGRTIDYVLTSEDLPDNVSLETENTEINISFTEQ